MSIPPHRAPGDLGHIEDHNAIVDVLTGNDADIASVAQNLSNHIAGEDPHGDRAWASEQFAPINHTHNYPVTSVNGETGEVVLGANDVGAITAQEAQNLVSELENYVEDTFIPYTEIGIPGGLTPLNEDGLIELEYLPGFGGASRVTVDDTPPSSPNEGDVWINTSETLPEPSPVMPTRFRTRYAGPQYMPHNQLAPASVFATFPSNYWPSVTFTTGPSGYTKITTKVGTVNNNTAQSTTAISYALSGGYTQEASFDQGAYQWPRGLQNSAFSRVQVTDELELPPNTEVTLTPTYRLSSVPSAAAQNGDDNALKFGISESMANTILIECW